ncbi:TetR/AcrR family transcriptional regulator [Acidaminobacter sp. JC074]|uniref:TetR/AcrR family transcriptional regulator n=1 Tax=Acidaminobacter sp. JC074 TaxID=2530199 RepID=UPI001F10A51C|nr:TetR/AcrR family transcriptional regulator [Acidaminobacter sp. JC074]
MKSDRRVVYTKRVIKESLLGLLENNPLGKITIKDICIDADVNRGTFYRHYQDIYDLFEEIETEFIDKILSDSDQTFSINTLLNLIYKNQGFYREFFLNHLESDRIRKLLEKELHTQPIPANMTDDVTKVAINRFMYYGTTGLIREWVNTGCKRTPEEFENVFNDIIKTLM